jgi:type III pantothenate kinase
MPSFQGDGMALDLVLDIGNSHIKGGLFEGKTLMHSFVLQAHLTPHEELQQLLSNKLIQKALISSVHAKAKEAVIHSLEQQKISYTLLNLSKLKLILDVEEPEQLGQDRIANAYGALTLFPLNDCIVLDIGTAITADFVAKEGRYLGGMIYPGPTLCAKALADYTDKLPLVTFAKPPSPLAKTTQTHLQGGIYYGQLGAIERMTDALKLSAPSPSSVKVIATGGATRMSDNATAEMAFLEDLKELVDFINPQLTLVGLHEILSELN